MLDNTDELAFEVEFLTCVVDKKNDFLVLDADTHFCNFVGVHYSKIKQGKLSLLDLLIPQSRQEIVEKLCKKDSPYVYMDLYIRDNSSKYNFVHCTARNNDENSLCEITFVDVGKSAKKTKELHDNARTMNHLIDLVTGGVCLFKVNRDMHFEVLYANEACCRFFGTNKQDFNKRAYRIDELIFPEDKSSAFQAIGSAMATKKPIDMELRIMPRENEYIWCKMNSDIQRYDKDNCPIFHAMFTDITAIKQAQDYADSQREMLLKVLKNVPGAVFYTVIDDPMKLEIASSDFIHLLGFSRVELFEDYEGDLTRLIAPENLDEAKAPFENIQEGQKEFESFYCIKTKLGNPIRVSDRRKIVTLDSGEKFFIGMLNKAE